MRASARLGWRAGAAVAFAVTAALAVILTRSGPVDDASLTSARTQASATATPGTAHRTSAPTTTDQGARPAATCSASPHRAPGDKRKHAPRRDQDKAGAGDHHR